MIRPVVDALRRHVSKIQTHLDGVDLVEWRERLDASTCTARWKVLTEGEGDPDQPLASLEPVDPGVLDAVVEHLEWGDRTVHLGNQMAGTEATAEVAEGRLVAVTVRFEPLSDDAAAWLAGFMTE